MYPCKNSIQINECIYKEHFAIKFVQVLAPAYQELLLCCEHFNDNRRVILSILKEK